MINTEAVVVFAGVLISASGVVLAWRKAGAGVWATFIFGFALIVVGGPLSFRLKGLTVGGTGINVSLGENPISDKPILPQKDIEILRSDVATVNAKMLSLTGNLQKHVGDLADQVQNLAARTDQSAAVVERLKTIELEISKSRGDLNATREALAWRGIRVDVNDLLPAYSKIKSFLTEIRVTVSDTFGSSSTDPKPPRRFVIAFGSSVSGRHIQQFIDGLLPLGLDAVDFAAGGDNVGRIYIGSYQYEGLRLTPQKVAQLRTFAADTEAFVSIIRREKTKLGS